MAGTIRVRMTRTDKGCPDGFTVTEYQAGSDHHLPEHLANAFFSAGSADPFEAHEAADQADAVQLDIEHAIVATKKGRRR